MRQKTIESRRIKRISLAVLKRQPSHRRLDIRVRFLFLGGWPTVEETGPEGLLTTIRLPKEATDDEVVQTILSRMA